MTLLTANQQKTERVRSMARTFARANTTLAGRHISVDVTEERSVKAPGFSIGDDVYLNLPYIGNTDTTQDIIKVTGLNFHELSHAEYTPRSDNTMVQQIKGTSLMKVFNILEDQRIETMMAAKYPSVRPYFVMTIMQYIVKGDLQYAHALTYGRKFLPEQVRDEVRNRWHDASLLKDMERIIDRYRRIAFPQDTAEAHRLIKEFDQLMRGSNLTDIADPYGHNDDRRSETDCTGKGSFDPKAKKPNQQDAQDAVSEDEEAGSGSEDFVPTDDDEAGDDDGGQEAGEDGTDGQDGDGDSAGDEEGDDSNTDWGDATSGSDDEADADGDGDAEGSGKGDGQAGDTDGEGSGDGDGDASDGDAGDADGSGSGEGTEPGDGDYDGNDGDDDAPAGANGGSGAGKGGHHNPGMTDEELRDFANDVANKAARDERVQRDANVKRQAMNKIAGDIPDLDVRDYVLADADAVIMNASNRFKRELSKLWSDADPGWHSHKASGRINVQRAMRGGELDTLFDQWDEGKNDANSIELVMLVDYSGSMSGKMPLVSASLWAIKRAVEAIGGEVTVIGFDDGATTFYSKKDKAQRSKYRRFSSYGGTDPGMAIDQARMIFHYSDKSHKILLFLTDGMWDYPTRDDESIQQFHLYGVSTALAFLPWRPGVIDDVNTMTDRDKQSMFHGCQSYELIESAMDLVPLAQKMVKRAMTV